jgi:hypothetical protein
MSDTDNCIILSVKPTVTFEAHPEGNVIILGPINKYDGKTALRASEREYLEIDWHEGKVRATIKRRPKADAPAAAPAAQTPPWEDEPEGSEPEGL